jgi:polyisoprenoid-binding protein YceI
MKPILLALAAFFLATAVQAAEPWRILPAESSLNFQGHDSQGGPIAGGFGKMTGTITGDPDHLTESHIKIDVDLTSLSADMSDTAETLKETDWFNPAKFPHAVYESRSIAKRPDGRFEAVGDLTLKGVTAPVTLLFSFPVYGPKPGTPGTLRAVAKGTAQLSRGAFKVGGADWAGQVRDAVDVNFTLTAERPGP